MDGSRVEPRCFAPRPCYYGFSVFLQFTKTYKPYWQRRGPVETSFLMEWYTLLSWVPRPFPSILKVLRQERNLKYKCSDCLMLLVSQESRPWAINKSITFDSHKEAWRDPYGNHDQDGNGSLYCILELIVDHRRPWTTEVMSSMGPVVSRWWCWMPVKVCKQMSWNKRDLLSCIDKIQRNHSWDLAYILSWSVCAKLSAGYGVLASSVAEKQACTQGHLPPPGVSYCLFFESCHASWVLS